MPMERERYPKDWKRIATAVKDDADWKCEFCGKQCRRLGEKFDTHKNTLTVAHLNHTPEDCRRENLKALCAPCHLRYDAKHHAQTRRRKRTMTNSRAKGKRGELELAHILRWYGYNARRGQQYCGVNGDADVVGLPGIHIECKRVEKLNIDDAILQASDDAKAGDTPAVFHRKNGEGWKVTMWLDDWLYMYNRAEFNRRYKKE